MTRFWLIKLLRTIITLWFVVTFAFIVLRTSGTRWWPCLARMPCRTKSIISGSFGG